MRQTRNGKTITVKVSRRCKETASGDTGDTVQSAPQANAVKSVSFRKKAATRGNKALQPTSTQSCVCCETPRPAKHSSFRVTFYTLACATAGAYEKLTFIGIIAYNDLRVSAPAQFSRGEDVAFGGKSNCWDE